MCKFHKDVAIEIATGPNGVDPLRYGILMCALSKYWIDLYMPEMEHLDGYSSYEMATSTAVSALQQCEPLQTLGQNIPNIIAYSREHSPQLRAMVDEVISEQGLTLKSLNLPKKPLNDLKSISALSGGIYEGDPTVGLKVRERAEEVKQEPMRKALDALFQKDGFDDALGQMIAGSFARLMTEAQASVNPKLVSAYEKVPYGLRTAFLSCAMHGAGGTVGTHLICLAMPAAVGAFGMAASPFIAASIDRAFDWHKGNSFSWKRSLSVGAFSFAVAAGINQFWPHDHLNTDKAKEFFQKSQDTQDALAMAERQRYLKLPAELRVRVDISAAKKNISPEVYLSVCDGSDTLGRDILEFEVAQKGAVDTSWTKKIMNSLNL